MQNNHLSKKGSLIAFVTAAEEELVPGCQGKTMYELIGESDKALNAVIPSEIIPLKANCEFIKRELNRYGQDSVLEDGICQKHLETIMNYLNDQRSSVLKGYDLFKRHLDVIAFANIVGKENLSPSDQKTFHKARYRTPNSSSPGNRDVIEKIKSCLWLNKVGLGGTSTSPPMESETSSSGATSPSSFNSSPPSRIR